MADLVVSTKVKKRQFWVVINVVQKGTIGRSFMWFKRGSFRWLLVWLKKGQFSVVIRVVKKRQI